MSSITEAAAALEEIDNIVDQDFDPEDMQDIIQIARVINSASGLLQASGRRGISDTVFSTMIQTNPHLVNVRMEVLIRGLKTEVLNTTATVLLALEGPEQ